MLARLLLAKLVGSTLDTKEGYKTKIGSTSSVTRTLTLALALALTLGLGPGYCWVLNGEQ